MSIINLKERRKEKKLQKLLRSVRNIVNSPFEAVIPHIYVEQIETKSQEVTNLIDELSTLDFSNISSVEIENLEGCIMSYSRVLNETENILFNQPAELLDRIIESLKVMIQQTRSNDSGTDSDTFDFK
ncbi:MAG: hypothetical protein ACLFPL_02990 [Candidatus Nanoarchaeia archaeon]